MRYLKIYEEFDTIPSNFIRLDSIGHVLDPEEGVIYAMWKKGGYDQENPYEAGDDESLEGLSDEDREMVDKYLLSCESFVKDKINWDLIQTAKDLSLDYLDAGNELKIKVMVSETKNFNEKGHLTGRDVLLDVYKETFSHRENNIIWIKYFPNKMNITKKGFLSYHFTIEPQRGSSISWGLKAWEPEMTRELTEHLMDIFKNETMVNR